MTIFRDPVSVVVVASAAASAAFFAGVRRRGAPTALAAMASVDLLAGLVILALAAGHLGGVIGGALSDPGPGGSSFEYDFRFYSLVLVGTLIGGPALVCVLQARALSRGESRAWRRTVWAGVLLLVVNVPLIPIQGFAALLSALAAANVAALAAGRRQFRALAWQTQ